MRSTIEKDETVKSRAVYFTEDGVITKISSVVDTETDQQYTWFALQDVLPFLDGVYKFSDYLVVKTKNPTIFEIVRRTVDIKQRSSDRLLQKISTCDNAEIMLKLNSKSIKFYASKEIVEEFNVDINNEVNVAGSPIHTFYVTFKDNPDFIISKIDVPFNMILSGKEFDAEIPLDASKVSVYSKRLFNSYSME